MNLISALSVNGNIYLYSNYGEQPQVSDPNICSTSDGVNLQYFEPRYWN